LRFLALFGFLVGEGAMVVYSRRRIKMGRAWERCERAAPSPRKAKDHEQRTIKVFGCFGIDMTDDAPNPVTAESDHLVRHNLRAKAKAVCRLGFDNRPERQPLLKV
jgi:hypothetical protein